MSFDEAINVARRQADDEDRWQQEQQDEQDQLRRRLKDSGRQAADHLAEVGEEQFVLVKPSTAVLLRGPYKDAEGRRYDVVKRQDCWTIHGLGHHIDSLPGHPDTNPVILLLRDGTIGRFQPTPKTKIEFKGWLERPVREWVSTLELEPLHPRTHLTEGLVSEMESRLATAVVKHERGSVWRPD